MQLSCKNDWNNFLLLNTNGPLTLGLMFLLISCSIGRKGRNSKEKE